jgi:hypothetical protein
MLSWALFHVDRAYLHYRLAVIAVEDVGLGNLETIAELLYVLDTAKLRREAGDSGEWLMLSYLIEKLAVGAKDRNSCEMTVLKLMNHSQKEHDLDKWLGGSLDVSVMNAGVECVGLSESVMGRKKLMNLYADAHVPAVVRYCCIASLKKMKDRLGAGLGMVWKMIENEHVLTVRDDPLLLDDGQIGAYTGATFDKHTGEGKRAIGYWLKVNPEIRQWVDSQEGKETVVNRIGMLLFTREGSYCRDRLNYAGSPELQKNCQTTIDSLVGVSYGTVFESNCLHPHYESLLKSRRAITTG